MKRFSTFALSLTLFLIFVVPAYAQNQNAVIPEKNGDYPDPEHKGVRVRVFVHEPKEKPSTSVSAVCSADNESTAVVGATGWKLPSTVWKYKINTSSVPSSVGASNLSTIALNGFNSWTNAVSTISSKPTLTPDGTTIKTRSSYDGQNIIAWGRTSGSALGVTYTRYYVSSGLVVDVDTIMNQKFPWTLNTCSASAYDAADILVHEQGHWFGLNDHYTADYVENSMFGYGAKAETKKITLTTGDKAGINLIYY